MISLKLLPSLYDICLLHRYIFLESYVGDLLCRVVLGTCGDHRDTAPGHLAESSVTADTADTARY